MGVNVDTWKHIYLGSRKPRRTVNFIFALYKYTYLLLHTTNFYTQQQQQPFYGPLSRTTRVSWYQKKHSPTHHPDHHPIFISFFYFYLLQSIASYLFKLCASQSFCTTSFHVLFGLPLHLEPSTSYSNQCLLFAAHAHTITTCFAIVSILYIYS